MQTKHSLCAWHTSGCLGYMMQLENKLKKSLSPPLTVQPLPRNTFFFFNNFYCSIGFPRWLSGKESACQFRKMQEMWV